MALKKKVKVEDTGAMDAMNLKECSICSSELDEDDGDIRGYFGIIPVAFCCWCTSSLQDMVQQMNPHECEKCGHMNGEEDE